MWGSDGQGGSIIKVIGVGGGGGNAVNYMHEQKIKGVSFVVCNTDVQDLQKSPIEHKIQLGKKLTEGLGAGSQPERGRMAAEENIDEVRAMLADAKMAFVVAGMGGGTGTGASPLIAKVAKEMDILTVAVVTIPYYFERGRYKNALLGIQELKANVDAILTIKNDKILEIYGDLTMDAAEDEANKLLCTAVRGIAEIITHTGKHNVDFADVKHVMENSGCAIMGTGRASGDNRAIAAVEQALRSPLLDYDMRGAKGLLVNIVQGEKLLVREMNEIMDYIEEQTGEQVSTKYGFATDPQLGEDIAVTIIVTGFEEQDLHKKEAEVEAKTEVKEDDDDDVEVIDWDAPLPENEYDPPVEISTPSRKKPILSNPNITEAEKATPAVWRGTRKQRASVSEGKGGLFALDSNSKITPSQATFLKNNPD